MGSAAGGAWGAAAPPDFGETNFNTFRPPQILEGFVENMEFYLKRIKNRKMFTNFFII